MAFVQSAHHGFHNGAESYVDASGQPQHHHYAQNSSSSMQDPAKSAYYSTNLPPQMSCDIKPRLTKEQHDILENHFQKQQKPSTNTKKGFAEQLNVSLDKVNNWFQNRRAKSKQDAKKQAGAYNLFAQQQASNLNFSSDSDASPSFSSSEYYSMMQQCTADGQMSNGNAFDHQMHPFQEQSHINGLPYSTSTAPSDQFDNTIMPPQVSQDMFDSPQEMNRRTLTQEQFDAFAQNGGMMQSGQFNSLQNGFSGDSDVLHQVFPDMNQGDFKSQDAFAFPAPIGAPLSSNDSSIPSTISEQSMFPSSTAMQDHAAASDWADSRSSSVSVTHGPDNSFPAMQPPHQLPQQSHAATSSQWQPGQSVPVDPNDLQRQFREAQQLQQQHQAQHGQHEQHEQPLAWPADEAFVRRDSSNGTMLAAQMSQFAIQTPQPPQTSTFTTPPPPQSNGGSIAARRQRPRPAALGIASLRSQSYSGAAQPGSPSQQPQNLAPGQQLRRIRSTNVINGVAQGRVMKSMPGSAQRSPLSWTFADASNAARHASTSSMGNLAPPTPLSPSQVASQEHHRAQFPPWQSSGQFSRHASISETDAEHNLANAGQPQTFTSPPHTPMYHHQQHQAMAQARIGNTVITENTPPQSAPAVQTTFPANAFMPPPPQPHPQQPHTQAPQIFVPAPAPQFVPAPEQQFQMSAPAYAPAHQFAVSAPDAPPQVPIQFANGVPIVNAQGHLTMAYPPQMQAFPHPAPPQQPQQQYSFVTNAGASPGSQATSHLPKPTQQAEFFVHEYSPPSDIKRSATPRKPAADNNGPKNYTFANQGPEHFEKEKAKKGDSKSGTASNSPESAAST